MKKENRYTLSQGHQLHYMDEGPVTSASMTLLCLHGNPTWSYFFRSIVEHFSLKNIRVVALDHLGMGLSDRGSEEDYTLEMRIRHVEEFIQGMGLNKGPLTLIMHDWGGAIGMGVATRHPEWFKRYIFFNTAAFLSKNIPPSIAFLKIPFWRNFLIQNLNLFCWPATRMTTVRPLAKEVRENYLRPYKTTQDRLAISCFVKDIPLNSKHPSFKTLQKIEEKLNLPLIKKAPKLFLWGEKDFCFNQKFLAKWKTIYPQATFQLLEQAGHYVLEDQPKICLKLMEEFLSCGLSTSSRPIQASSTPESPPIQSADF